MNDQPVEPIVEDKTYCQAGHVLMAYLILNSGVADGFFAPPIPHEDRVYRVPELEEVDLKFEPGLSDRGSPRLRSLITTPLFLMGGEAAERLHKGVPSVTALGDSVAIGRANGMMLSYMEEFGGRDSPDRQDRFERDFRNDYDFVEGQVRDHWPSLEALAGSLQEEGKFPVDAAFERIESRLPEDSRRGVAANLGGE
jgi:hypothetical protein